MRQSWWIRESYTTGQCSKWSSELKKIVLDYNKTLVYLGQNLTSSYVKFKNKIKLKKKKKYPAYFPGTMESLKKTQRNNFLIWCPYISYPHQTGYQSYFWWTYQSDCCMPHLFRSIC